MRDPRLILATCLLCGLGCDEDDDVAGGGDAGTQVGDVGVAGCEGVSLEFIAVDAWGRPLTPTSATVDGAAATQVSTAGAGDWAVAFTADEYEPVAANVRWSGASDFAGVTVEGAPYWAVSLDPGEGGTCGRYGVFLAAEHAWFESSARPWHAGNTAQLFSEPSLLWADIAGAIRGARSYVFWATWWWSSDHELVRLDDPDADAAARQPNTSLGLLQAASARAEVRVLVNQFLGDVVEGGAFITSDLPLRHHGEDNTDAIEVMVHANRDDIPLRTPYEGVAPAPDFEARVRAEPRWTDRRFAPPSLTQNLEPTFPVASYHMKGVVVDHDTAYVVGVNTQSDYWDDAQHRVFNPLRIGFEATPETRRAVAERAELTVLEPFQDYGIKLMGPAVGEVERYYAATWNQALAHPEAFAADGTPYLSPPLPAARGGLPVQIQATLPPPMAEQSILLGQLRAIRQARRYILVEDQYWRAGRLLDALVTALETYPELVLVVVTNEIANGDGGKKYTIEMDQALRAQFADRYLVLQLRAFDVQTAAEATSDEAAVHDISVYNHSKLMIIDDVYLTVGSANKNNRSLLYDGEMNAVVLDPAWVTAAARQVVSQWVGPAKAGQLPADFSLLVPALQEIADENVRIVEGWVRRLPDLTDADIIADRSQAPFGHIFPYVPSDQYLLEVGPDFF